MCVFYEGKKNLRTLNTIIEMKSIKYKKKYREKDNRCFFTNPIDVYNDTAML